MNNAAFIDVWTSRDANDKQPTAALAESECERQPTVCRAHVEPST
jgi:hypothetical protein